MVATSSAYGMCRPAYKRRTSSVVEHYISTRAQRPSSSLLTLDLLFVVELTSQREKKSDGSGKGQCRRSWQQRRGAGAGPPLRAPSRQARGVGGVHGRRPRRVGLQHRRLDKGQTLPRRRRARFQVQPVGAQRGGGGRGGVHVVRRAEGRQGVQVRQRPRHAEARRQLLHLHVLGALPVRHEDRRHRRLIDRAGRVQPRPIAGLTSFSLIN